MSITIQTINNKEYKVSSVTDLHYSVETEGLVIVTLDRIYKSKERIRIHLGDKETGRVWLEEYDVIGYVGRSTGQVKIPLLINNSRSLGGGTILTHCILAIQNTETKGFLYKHDIFKIPAFEYEYKNDERLAHRVYAYTDGKTRENVANFTTEKKAYNYIAFMRGERMSK